MFDIIMPLFNKEDFVAEAIKSVLAQHFSDWRLFVIDDGSSDRSLAVVKRFDDHRISVLQQPNSGPGVARNTGIAAGSADWIAFLDADDRWLDDHLATLDRLRRRFPNAVLIGTSFVHWRGGEHPPLADDPSAYERPIRYFHEVASKRKVFFTSSAAVSRRAIQEVGPLKPVLIGDETELWARLALHGLVVASKRSTVLYRIDTGGITDSNVGQEDKTLDTLTLEDVSLPIATLLERLPAIDDPVIRRDVTDYIDYEAGIVLTHALRHGRIAYARKISQLFLVRPRGAARIAVLLAKLPFGWGRTTLFLIFGVKTFLRRQISRLQSFASFASHHYESSSK